MPSQFEVTSVSTAAEVARREVDRHRQRFIGITINAPSFQDVNGVLEYVVDVRIGTNEKFEIVREVLIAQEAQGIVTDAKVPVTIERSENGRLSIIARSDVRLPDIQANSYTFGELGFAFMSLLESGSPFTDGFGHLSSDPEATDAVGTETIHTFTITPTEWGGTDFVYGTSILGDATAEFKT